MVLLHARIVDRPLILLSNDDGHFSRGIQALRAALQKIGDVVIAAPETEQSAASHALSLHKPLRLRRVQEGLFAIDGTPADCVYVALHAEGRVVPRRPDLVVSGINHGLNLGQDVFYSGTVAAAREGALRGVPAIAASANTKADFEEVAAVCADLATRVLGRTEKLPLLLNVNFPQKWPLGLRVTKLGARFYDEVLDFRKDPRNREYFWIGGPGVRHEPDPGSDTDAYDQGAVSITPLMLDLTSTAHQSLLTDLLR